MVQQVTKGIKIQYAFGYKVTIENQSSHLVQLDWREWAISDALNNIEMVSGEGVIGKKPILNPGESHTYTSGCLLTSPFGAMQGFYTMINLETKKKFKVAIPAFRLSAPFALN